MNKFISSIKMYRGIATLTLAVIVATLVFVPNHLNASSVGARAAARVLFDNLRTKGWTVRDCFDTGLLRRGQSVRIRTELYAGNIYTIAAGGCEDAHDVDIAIYDENGNFISGDEDRSDLAVARVKPKWSGTFYIVVTMYDSTRDGAHYVVQYAFARE